jgi:hypothetical protein
MAGDWIPITVDLTRRREVLIVAAKCGMTPREVVGGLIEFWGWVSMETADGRLRNVFVATLVAQFGLPECYWRALEYEGWLEESVEGIIVPNFERWLSNGAKARLGNALRQKEYRRKVTKGATNVVTSVATNVATKALPQNSTVQKSKESITTLRSVIDSSEPSPKASEPAVLTFPVVGKDAAEWALEAAFIAELQAAYPGVDVPAECAKARAWCVANPANRKTARGMTRFLNGWMERAQNGAHRSAQPARTARPTLTREQREESLRRYDAEHGD